jgi:hypothetical protein
VMFTERLGNSTLRDGEAPLVAEGDHQAVDHRAEGEDQVPDDPRRDEQIAGDRLPAVEIPAPERSTGASP